MEIIPCLSYQSNILCSVYHLFWSLRHFCSARTFRNKEDINLDCSALIKISRILLAKNRKNYFILVYHNCYSQEWHHWLIKLIFSLVSLFFDNMRDLFDQLCTNLVKFVMYKSIIFFLEKKKQTFFFFSKNKYINRKDHLLIPLPLL